MVNEESAVLTNMKGRKDRSVSNVLYCFLYILKSVLFVLFQQSLIATSENVAMCKAASRLQNLVSQMSDKKDKSVSRPKVYNRERTTRE